MNILGIDIGGTGIKAAPVDTKTGVLLSERQRILTPQPATPEAIAAVVAELVDRFKWQGPIGCGFPAPIKDEVAQAAANIDSQWIGTHIGNLFSKATGCSVHLVNDADAAGIAEIEFGAGVGRKGVILMVTMGTGLGSALFTDGRLLPNSELGHVLIDGQVAEKYASEIIRKQEGLSWKKWAKRFDKYLLHMQRLFWPDLIILGGGGSRKFDKFADLLTVEIEVIPAQMLNEAGIVGAALAARPEY